MTNSSESGESEYSASIIMSAPLVDTIMAQSMRPQMMQMMQMCEG